METLAILYSVVNNPSVLFLLLTMGYFTWVSRHLVKSKIQELSGHKDSAAITRAKSRALCKKHARPVVAAWQSLRHAHRQAFPKNLAQAGVVGRDLSRCQAQARQPRRAGRQGHGGQKKASSSNDDGDGGDGEPPHPHLYPLVLNYVDLADLLKIAPGTLKNRYSQAPDTLPPAILIPGCRGPRWLLADVIRWLEDHRTTPAAPAPKRKAGRPRLAAGKGGVV